MNNQELGTSLTKTIIESENLQEIVTNLSEIGLDTIVGSNVANDIPFISTITQLWKAGVSIRDAIFLRKLAHFLLELSDTDLRKRNEMINKLDQEEYQGKVGEGIILLLERLDSLDKASMLGRAFQAYIQEEISFQSLQRINVAIDRIPIYDLKSLPQNYQESLNEVSEEIRQMYLAGGLGWFVLNFSSEGFEWTKDVCDALISYVL